MGSLVEKPDQVQASALSNPSVYVGSTQQQLVSPSSSLFTSDAETQIQN
jgi:hypothetical protein